MSHGRTQIRNALAAALTGLTTTGARVFVNRVHPVTESELPCLMVSTDDEQVSAETLRVPRLLSRRLTATVRILARASASLDTTLDTAMGEVETALAADVTLGSLARDTQLDRIDFTLDDGAERPTAAATLTYLITWAATEGAPATPL